MDVADDVIPADPRSCWFAALRAGVGALVLVVGFFILGSVFGGTAAHAASETEPDAADSSLVRILSGVVSSVAAPQAAELQDLGSDGTEPVDAVLSELPIVPAIAGEAPVNSVVSSVLHTSEWALEIIPENDSAAADMPTAAVPLSAPTTVVDSMSVDPSPTPASSSAATLRGAAGTSLASRPLPLTHDQPVPVSSTASTGISAGSTAATPAVDPSGVGWSSPAEGAESRPAQNKRCPESATYDFDSTPD